VPGAASAASRDDPGREAARHRERGPVPLREAPGHDEQRQADEHDDRERQRGRGRRHPKRVGEQHRVQATTMAEPA
jgi:hypothetical protein